MNATNYNEVKKEITTIIEFRLCREFLFVLRDLDEKSKLLYDDITEIEKEYDLVLVNHLKSLGIIERKAVSDNFIFNMKQNLIPLYLKEGMISRTALEDVIRNNKHINPASIYIRQKNYDIDLEKIKNNNHKLVFKAIILKACLIHLGKSYNREMDVVYLLRKIENEYTSVMNKILLPLARMDRYTVNKAIIKIARESMHSHDDNRNILEIFKMALRKDHVAC